MRKSIMLRKRGNPVLLTHAHQLKDSKPSSSSRAGGAGRHWDASYACSFDTLNACDVGWLVGQREASGPLREPPAENWRYREPPVPVWPNCAAHLATRTGE